MPKKPMDKLSSAYSKLQQAAILLDEAAHELSGSDIPARTADIQSVGEALAAIADVKRAIYKARPDLMPADLQLESPDPEFNREFGRSLIQSEHLLAMNQPGEAIKLFEAFLETKPPGNFKEMADNEIQRIKELFSV